MKKRDMESDGTKNYSERPDEKVHRLDEATIRDRTVEMETEQRIRVLQWLKTYDPRDEQGFQLVVANCLNLVGRTDRVAQILGVTKSTLNRWISGEVTPIKMARLGTVLVFEELLKEMITGKTASMKNLRERYARELEKLDAQDKPLTFVRKEVRRATAD